MLAWPGGQPRPPVVVGFEHDLLVLLELRTVARAGDCRSGLALRGRLGNQVPGGSFTGFPQERPGDRRLLLRPVDAPPYAGLGAGFSTLVPHLRQVRRASFFQNASIVSRKCSTMSRQANSMSCTRSPQRSQ